MHHSGQDALLIIENSSLDGGSGEAPRPWSRATTELSLRLAENHEAVENFADAAKEYQQLIRAASEDPMVLRNPQQLPTMYSFLALALKRGGQLARAEPVYLAALQLTSAFGDEGQRKHILQMLLSLYLDMAFEEREKIVVVLELTVPHERNMQKRAAYKSEKYAELLGLDLEWTAHLFTQEFGALLGTTNATVGVSWKRLGVTRAEGRAATARCM